MLQFGYITLSVLMAILILLGYNHALKAINQDKSKRQNNLTKVGVAIFFWFAYTYMIGQSGWLQSFALPPRFPLFLVLPPFIFTAVVLYKNHNSPVIKAIPKSWLIYYQSFRIIVESLFVASVAQSILHPEVTFEGYNYDIVFAATAPIVAFLVFNKKVLSQKVALYWNYLGLIVIAFIIFLFTTTTYFPSVWGSTTPLADLDFLVFPYVLVASFLMPSAVFIHCVSIIQLKKYEE